MLKWTIETPKIEQGALEKLQHQNLIILDALADLLAEYPLPEARKTEVDIYTELIEAGRRELKDVPEALKEAVGKELRSGKEEEEGKEPEKGI